MKLNLVKFALLACSLLIQVDIGHAYNLQRECRSGDLNNDGYINDKDLTILERCWRYGPHSSGCDINYDLQIDHQDVISWIKCSKGTCIGDVNLDGVFDSSDLVLLFQSRYYESGEDGATWQTGDWNGDGKFDSQDLLIAFKEGCYEGELEY